MISSALRTISSLLILISLGITVFTLYFMANDLSSMGISLTIKDLEVSDSSLHFNLFLNFSYSGLYPVYDFQVKMNVDFNQFYSQSTVLQKGLNVISIPSNLNLHSIGKNVTATMTISGVYARIMPVTVTVPSKDYLRIDIFPGPIDVIINDYNTSHAVVISRMVSIAKINVNVVVVLMVDNEEIDKKILSPPIEAGDVVVLTWYVKYEDLDRLSSIELYLSSTKGLIKIYSWRVQK